jgi:G:T-mismatch repair DNA endonuclease (very short patch repair protein)
MEPLRIDGRTRTKAEKALREAELARRNKTPEWIEYKRAPENARLLARRSRDFGPPVDFSDHHIHVISDSERNRRSVARKKMWKNREFKKRMLVAIRKASCMRPNLLERKIEAILNKNFPNQWKYVGDGATIIGGKNPDFIRTDDQKVVLEAFGTYWHSERITGIPAAQHVSDRVAHFARYGFKCLVIWEHEVNDEQSVLNRLATFAS